MIRAGLGWWRKLSRDEGGNIALMFGAASIPLLLMMGGAVDFSRYARYKADLTNAVDAGSIALGHNAELYADECKKVGETCPKAGVFLNDFVATVFAPDDFEVATITVVRTANGFRVTVDGNMQAAFLPLGRLLGGSGTDTLALSIEAAVDRETNRLELALVFDNTGSMNMTDTGSGTRMENLKAAANALLDVLMPAGTKATDDVKIAVVPFEGTVNILNDSFSWNWIDKGEYQEWTITKGKKKKQVTTTYKKWYGRSKYNGINVETVDDKAGNPRRPSHFWLYDMIDVEWAGCVEMRQEHYDAQTKTTIPYDILDTAPDQNKPETLFVQSFWPDEPDEEDVRELQRHNHYTNNYLADRDDDDDDDDDDGVSNSALQRNFGKYERNEAWRSDVDSPYSSGPNHGCPRPIVPLTPIRATVKDAIDGMEAYGAMGTFIPNGLVWGWHVLSSGEPFSEGIGPQQPKFSKTQKAIVLLSDGENSATLTSDPDNHNKSLYSGYNYFTAGRLGTVADNASPDGPNAKLNAKTAALCSNVKGDKVRVYTITFGAIPEAAKTLMRNCASTSEGEQLYFHAPTGSALEDVFKEIGADLSNLHLSM